MLKDDIPCGLEPLKFILSDARRGHWRTLKIKKGLRLGGPYAAPQSPQPH